MWAVHGLEELRNDWRSSAAAHGDTRSGGCRGAGCCSRCGIGGQDARHPSHTSSAHGAFSAFLHSPALPPPLPQTRGTFPDACVLETARDGFSLPLARHVILLPANRNTVSSWRQGGRGGGSASPDTRLPEGATHGQALSQGGAAQNKEHAWGLHHGLPPLHFPQWAPDSLSVRWGHWTRVRVAPFANCWQGPVLGSISWQPSQVGLIHFPAGKNDTR